MAARTDKKNKVLPRMLLIVQDENTDVKATDKDGKTLLHQVLLSEEVSEKEVMELLQLLLDRGVDPNIKDASEKTALHLAVEMRMKEVVDLLIERGAQKDVIDKYGDSIAHHFIVNEYIECIGEKLSTREQRRIEVASFIEFMIARGFDFDRKNEEGETALHRAASNRHVPHVLLALLEHAGDIDFASEHNKTLLHLVLDHGRVYRDKSGTNYTSRRATIVKLLLDRGVPVETADKSGRTALHTAIHLEEHMSTVEIIGDRLLEACQNSTTANCLFFELIGICASWSYSRIDYFLKLLRALIAKGADVNATDESGRFPIHFAAECKAVGCLLIKFLLNDGCNVNAEDEAGNSALHFAVRHLDNTSVVRLLIESGCDVNAKNKLGNSALHFAACDPRNAAVVRLLVELGALVNCKNEDMETPLHLAVNNWDGENLEVAELLLESGVNVNSKDDAGRAVLSKVASRWSYSLGMLQLLLRRGAYVNARDKDGKTALYWALSRSRSMIVKELLNYIVDVSEDYVFRFIERNIVDETGTFIKKHCTKLKAANLHCLYNCRPRHEIDFDHRKYNEKCLKEVETLKSTFISSRTSLYDFLHTNVNNRGIHIHNEKLQQLVDSPALKQQFPRYAALILASHREVVAKKLLIEEAKLAWLALTEIHLPDVCIERILDYLTDTDLIDMADMDESKA